MNIGFGCTALLVGVLLALTGPATASPLDLVSERFRSEQPQVTVADPFIELHTGPGRGYPIFYVAGEGEQVVVLKRKTDWFLIRMPRGSFDSREGWVHVDQLRRTLDPAGNAIDIPSYGMDDFVTRRWELGLAGGDIDGAASISGTLTFNLTPHIGLHGELAQILGDHSDGYMGSVSVVIRPFPGWRVSPYFGIGTGYIAITPQTTIVQTQDLKDEIVHAGFGADVYMSRKFLLRLEYRRHTVLTSRDDNEEINQWKAGFSIFF
jgi:hypothetical protein